MQIVNEIKAKPFLKWAGGKTQLLPEIERYLPPEFKKSKIRRYVEPFVGSGALLFYLLQKYDFLEAFIFDINQELINTYEVIKDSKHDGLESLISQLKVKEEEFHNLNNEKRKVYYKEIRRKFNENLPGFDFKKFNEQKIKRAVEFIFLNKTCFNGLYRVNKLGEFNVPMGDYKKPTICNESNLRAVHKILQRVEIQHGDYRMSQSVVDKNSFVYFDPPYKPLSTTSSFTSYSKHSFGDNEQIELANYVKLLHKTGAKLMVSNSDPKNVDENDEFFETHELYGDNDIFNIYKVQARRNINSKGNGRGVINELLITNY